MKYYPTQWRGGSVHGDGGALQKFCLCCGAKAPPPEGTASVLGMWNTCPMVVKSISKIQIRYQMIICAQRIHVSTHFPSILSKTRNFCTVAKIPVFWPQVFEIVLFNTPNRHNYSLRATANLLISNTMQKSAFATHPPCMRGDFAVFSRPNRRKPRFSTWESSTHDMTNFLVARHL